MNEALLLSGGIDSTALAYWRRPVLAVTIDYGQRAAPAELRAAGAVSTALALQHVIIRLDCSALGVGVMAGSDIPSSAPTPEWWPFRNQFLVTIAAMRLATAGIQTLLIGTVCSDRAHLDGTPEFVARLSELLRLQEFSIELKAPALDLSTIELVRASRVPEDILRWAHSCHASEYACGNCRGCHKHRATMEALGFLA